MAAVGNAEEKHRIATGCVHKMFRMYAECCHAEKCAADTSVSKWCYLVHQPALDDKRMRHFFTTKNEKRVRFRLSKYGNL